MQLSAGFSLAVLFRAIPLCLGLSFAMPHSFANTHDASTDVKDTSWQLGPFVKPESVNPILAPQSHTQFLCPVKGQLIAWEAKDVFNPAAVVRDGKVYLLYRAEDFIGAYAGTSRIGLASSEDGLTFTRREHPVLYPDNDAQLRWENEGGVEDPRVVEDADGRYIMTYTAYDGKLARLMVASSDDLVNWQKHGPAFEQTCNGKYLNTWSKSGSIVTRRQGERFVAEKIDGRYWMYWGEASIYLAHSEDLLNWTVVEQEGQPLAVLKPRLGFFDSVLVEPGPQALLTEQGILLLYNGKNSANFGDQSLAEGTYAAGQVLFSASQPTQVLKRSSTFFLKPEKAYEKQGQVNHVVFIEGLVYFKGTWHLYYGAADSLIAAAVYQE